MVQEGCGMSTRSLVARRRLRKAKPTVSNTLLRPSPSISLDLIILATWNSNSYICCVVVGVHYHQEPCHLFCIRTCTLEQFQAVIQLHSAFPSLCRALLVSWQFCHACTGLYLELLSQRIFESCKQSSVLFLFAKIKTGIPVEVWVWSPFSQ